MPRKGETTKAKASDIDVSVFILSALTSAQQPPYASGVPLASTWNLAA
jgi:hypothetical protein